MSKNYSKVKTYYDRKLWKKQKVYDVVGKWITPEEYFTITGERYIE